MFDFLAQATQQIVNTGPPQIEMFTKWVVGIAAALGVISVVLVPALRKVIRDVKELKSEVRTNATATAVLIDANKQNPATPNVPPHIESAVKATSTGAGGPL